MRIIGIKPSARQFFVAILGISVFLYGIWLAIFHMGETKPVFVQYHARPQIILDAGHGGMDGGAVGVNNTPEQGINLAITLKLKELLQLNGFEVILTRENENSIHDPSETSVAKQKRSDMRNRMKIIENHPNALFVSIHQNKFSDPSCKGAQIFFSPNHSDSEQLAKLLQESFRENLQPENSREIKISDESLYLLWNAEIPAVLVECGFLSNPNECDLLCDESYQEKIAFVIYLSLLDFYQL